MFLIEVILASNLSESAFFKLGIYSRLTQAFIKILTINNLVTLSCNNQTLMFN